MQALNIADRIYHEVMTEHHQETVTLLCRPPDGRFRRLNPFSDPLLTRQTAAANDASSLRCRGVFVDQPKDDGYICSVQFYDGTDADADQQLSIDASNVWNCAGQCRLLLPCPNDVFGHPALLQGHFGL